LFAGTWYPGSDGHGTIAPIPAVVQATPPSSNVAGSLTDAQSVALAAFDKINAASFGNWFNRSTFMAFCQTESEFNTKAFRQEPSGVASYGLMQVLDSTAAGLGLVGPADQMYDPEIGVFYGLKYAAQGWNYLQTHFGRPPTQAEWAAGYNEGYGAAANGKPDPNYVSVWSTHKAAWLYLDA
jgi:soluble lytic murein transglycosylase-like protein